MPFANPHMKLISAKIGNISEEKGRVVVNALSREDPAHVRPQAAVLGGMWVPFFVCVLVMHSMYGHEEDGPTFQGQGATDG
jgi:hypothetical protein